MKRNTAYTDKDGLFTETYLFKFGNFRKILVKKDGNPYQIIRFNIKKENGRKLEPFETINHE